MFKKLIAFALVCMLALSLAACSGSKAADKAAEPEAPKAEAASEEAKAPETPAEPGDAVAVKVGEEVAKCSEVENMYQYYVSMYQNYGMPAPTADADIESMQDMIIDSIAQELVLVHKAKEQGYTVTDEQKAELDEMINGQRDEMIESYIGNVALGEDATEEQKKAAALALINAEITAYYGHEMTLDDYLEGMRGSYESNYLVENLESGIKASASVNEEDIHATYDTYLAADKAAYEDDAVAYLTAEENYEMLGGRPVLFTPEGYARIKALTVYPKAELNEEYETVKADMTALEAEYGALVLGGYTEDTRVSEIETEYAELKEKAAAMYEAYTEGAYAKAQEAFEELETGTPFETVFAANNEDTDYATYAAFGEKGRLIMTDADDGVWKETVRDAVKELTKGMYSKPVEVDGTYYILYLVGPEPAGERAFDTVRDEIETVSVAERGETVWTEMQEAWMADESLIIRYPENYRYIGKNA